MIAITGAGNKPGTIVSAFCDIGFHLMLSMLKLFKKHVGNFLW